MAFFTKTVFKKFAGFVCIGFSAVYASSALTPFVNPVNFWPMTFLSLAFPLLLAGMTGVCLLSLLMFKKYCWLFVLVLALGYTNIRSIWGFHPNKFFSMEKPAGSIRILSWNVNEFLNAAIENDTPGNPRRQMLAFIQQSNADILCFQDFATDSGRHFRSTLPFIRDSLHYPYTAFVNNFSFGIEGYGIQRNGIIIFSRLPIIDSAIISLPNSEHFKEDFQWVTVQYGQQKLKIINAHLRSMNLHGNQALPVESQFYKPDTILFLQKSTFSKLRYFDKVHVAQTNTIQSVMDTTELPFVFCGDLNAVPSSYVYHQLSNGLQDAFLKTGWGLGGTYDSISPTLRIDVMLMRKPIIPIQHQTFPLHLSDHYPSICDVWMKE
ncbi:endonuclease/exonuclease/phosphatase family protein [Hydrotalea sp.]|uniref:endonuclease/exonuclease/phosphatase family protein n=1 Tax=Hydrotalea sp. TaxID=2881279 RepID=UPI002631E9E2|nr:endonuclease/exonuclease/phosphatase family protein [Hydrotalea sp.]